MAAILDNLWSLSSNSKDRKVANGYQGDRIWDPGLSCPHSDHCTTTTSIISPTILLLHLSIIYFNQMVPHLFLLSLKLNSPLKPLLPTLVWMILGIFLLNLHPLTTSFLKFKFFIMTFSIPSLTLILGRLTVRMESLLFFSKIVLPSWFKLLSVSLYFLLEVCSHSIFP